MNELFPAKKTQVSLKTCEMEFNITHNWRDVLYSYQKMPFCI